MAFIDLLAFERSLKVFEHLSGVGGSSPRTRRVERGQATHLFEATPGFSIYYFCFCFVVVEKNKNQTGFDHVSFRLVALVPGGVLLGVACPSWRTRGAIGRRVT